MTKKAGIEGLHKISWTFLRGNHVRCRTCGKKARSSPKDCEEPKHSLFWERVKEKARLKYPETRRFYYLKRTYGMGKEEYHRLLSDQEGVCAICRGLDEKKILSVDHSHRTGDVRGLLCNKCNYLVGYLESETQYRNLLMERVLNYLSIGDQP